MREHCSPPMTSKKRWRREINEEGEEEEEEDVKKRDLNQSLRKESKREFIRMQHQRLMLNVHLISNTEANE